MWTRVIAVSLPLSSSLFPQRMASSASNEGIIFQFSANSIDGELVSLEKYRGFVTLIVNVASKCGLTDTNYRQLQELHTRLAGKGLRILAFPCNQFGHQEPWSETEIKRWVTEKYNVEFDMFSKIDVNGSNAHPLYKFLKHEQGGFLISAIKWNFAKFLVDRDGKPVRRYSPQTKPFEIEKDIIALLEQ